MAEVISFYAEETIEELLEEYGSMLIRLAFTYVRNLQDAEDILQDVFMKFLEKNPQWESKQHQKAWFIKVTINRSKNCVKSSWHRLRSENCKEETYTPEMGNDVEVLKAVLELPIRYKEAIHLYYYEEYSTTEIAEILGKRPSTIRSLLKRGRELLKKKLKEEYGYDEEAL